MRDHQSLIREEFSRQADTLAKGAVFNDQAVLERIRQAAQLTQGMRALDVACGPGIVAEMLARDAGEVVACDVTPEMLSKTQRRCAAAGLSNVQCVPGRAEALPFDDASFNVVVCRSALHHFQEPAASLREMARVVRDDGRVIIVDVVSSDDEPASALHNALEILRDPSHIHMLSRSEVQSHLRAAGLTVRDHVEWTNHREFDEWLRITNAPERVGPLRVVMTELANRGAHAGIGLRLDSGEIRFDHTAMLIVAGKQRARSS